MESASKSQVQQRRYNNGVAVPPSPRMSRFSVGTGRDSLLPRDGSSSVHEQAAADKGVNIQVILRCRPLNEEEMQVKSSAAVSCNEQQGSVSVMQNSGHKQINRTFTYDKVFGPTCEQKELFDSAICPMVNEVVEGYNCTIFAYGQTGTGKTYTMAGGQIPKEGNFPSDAGIIARAVQQIYDILEARRDDYSIRVTLLELYNEEITDLLAPDDSLNLDEKLKRPIALMEDGKGGVYVRGLEQQVARSADAVYGILEKGSAKRRTADTLLNKQSSRSHTIFSIAVHIKESSSDGEELIKCGKLNLVDLGGSENITRSGAREARAREAGEINKSLLTLGRVINALVEQSGHIPYRDSKLTRLLRDSLGGKTKTCIIATISPSVHSLEETLNTLDYAHRAKHIKNRPEINQRMTKSELLRDLYAEIDHLRLELKAAREKNGIYITEDCFLNEEAKRKAMTEKMECLEVDLEMKNQELMDQKKLQKEQQLLTTQVREELHKTKKELVETQNSLNDLEGQYRQANLAFKEREYVICHVLQSEKALAKQALELRTVLEDIASEACTMVNKIELQDKLEAENKMLVTMFRTQLAQQLESLHGTIASSVAKQEQELKALETDFRTFASEKAGATEAVLWEVNNLKDFEGYNIKNLENIVGELLGNMQSSYFNSISEMSKSNACILALLDEMSSEIDSFLDHLQSDLLRQGNKLTEYAQQQHEGLHRTLQMTCTTSEAITKFFDTLSVNTSNINKIVKGTRSINGKKLCQLEKEFEECAAMEKRCLLEKVAELVDDSNLKKKRLVQTAITGLIESNEDRTCMLQREVSKLQNFARSVRDEWKAHMDAIKTNSLNATAAVQNEKDNLETGIHNCISRVRMGTTRWQNAQELVLDLQKRNTEALDRIAKDGMEASRKTLERLSSVALSSLGEADRRNNSLISSIESLLKLDKAAEEKNFLVVSGTTEDMKELTRSHYSSILRIKENTKECFDHRYKVAEPFSPTTLRRLLEMTSTKSTKEIKSSIIDKDLTPFLGDTLVMHEPGDEDALSGAGSKTPSSLTNKQFYLTIQLDDIAAN